MPDLTLTCADYARIMRIAAGQVTPEGIDLTLVLGRGGSWKDRAEMLRRALHDPAVQGGEASMAGQLRRIDKGDRSMVGLPVFPLRNFTARDLYVCKGGTVKSPTDLPGKRIGMYDWFASGSIWYRHFLNFLGVALDSLEWWIGDVDEPRAPTHLGAFPAHVHQPGPGRFLSEMLLAGELDAIYSPPRPRDYHPAEGPIVRLFPDVRAVERDYFRRTGCFPPQHLLILRREAWERNKWIARSLTDAFISGNDLFAAAQRNFPYVSPWLDVELEETEALMGADFHPYGFDKNKAVIDAFCRQAYDAGIVGRVVSAEEYFAEFLQS